jgi:hypothetical protein
MFNRHDPASLLSQTALSEGSKGVAKRLSESACGTPLKANSIHRVDVPADGTGAAD